MSVCARSFAVHSSLLILLQSVLCDKTASQDLSCYYDESRFASTFISASVTHVSLGTTCRLDWSSHIRIRYSP